MSRSPPSPFCYRCARSCRARRLTKNRTTCSGSLDPCRAPPVMSRAARSLERVAIGGSVAQPALGIAASLVAMAISLAFISLFDFPSFAGNVTFFTLCLIPMQVMAVVLWGANPPFLAKMGQPAKGLALLRADDRRGRRRVRPSRCGRSAKASARRVRFPRTSRSSRCRRRSISASSSAGGRSTRCSRTRWCRASSRSSPPTW